MSTDADTSAQKDENLLGQKMLELAKKEGHKKRFPRNNTGHFVPPPSRVRQEIMDYFSANPDPASTNELLKHIDSKAPNLRRVCRDMIKDGLMRSERGSDGCIYTFVGDINFDEDLIPTKDI